MVVRSGRWFTAALALLACVLAGCYDPADPDTYPLRLVRGQTTDDIRHFADLDGDGHDEVLVTSGHAEQAGHVAVLVMTLGGKVIEQVNVPSSYALTPLERLHTLDLDGDGTLEVLVPLVRNDSLFVRAYDGRGRLLHHLFLATGEPRHEGDGVLAWDPDVPAFYREDLTGDGHAELVTVMFTGYARAPRGLLAHDLWSGERVGTWLVGAALSPGTVHTVAGRRTLFFGSYASNNGGAAGGLRDSRAYVGAVPLALPLRAAWVREAGGRGYTTVEAALLGPDGARLLATEISTASQPGPDRLRVLDAATGGVLRERTWPGGIRGAVVGAGPGGEDRVYVVGHDGRVAALTPELRVVAEWRRRTTAGGATLSSALIDVDGDGVEEVALRFPDRTEILGADLETRAVVPLRLAPLDLVQRGRGRPPLVSASTGGVRPQTTLFRVEANPWWWFHRYGPAGLVGFGALALVGLAVAGVQRTRSHRLAEAVRERVLAGDERGLLLLDPGGSVAEANPAFREHFGLNGEAGADLRRALGERAPSFEGFLAALPEGPPHRREAAVEMGGGDAAPAWVVAEPLGVGRGRPHWLVSVAPVPVGGLSDETWPLLARRVVHDLKNPLTSILLTLQRMQMEAHAHAPEEPAGDLAARLDPYVERVEGRVEHLRRMAQNLLKFLDAAVPELADVDLCAVVERCVESLRSAMPPDVRLDLRRCTEPVPVRADAEQVCSALENLVMNALQAMPDGGAVTVQARVARRLQPEGAPAPRDYAVLEVMDTGRGMDAEARRRAFEPGFTTRDGGTGLGLALVQKVVRDHGGFAEVESEPGTGTAVCLHLPLASHDPHAARYADPAPTIPPRDAPAD